MKNSFLFFCLSLLLFSCGNGGDESKLIPHELKGEAQGTTFTIKYLAKDSLDLTQEVMDMLVRIDQELSLWVDSSVISKFNAQRSTDRSIDSSANYFIEVFRRSQDVFALTDGAFNPAVMPLVRYWGFAKKAETPEVIDSLKVDSLRRHNGFIKVVMAGEGYSYFTPDENLQIDFNAIAQGYSVDLICELLDEKGLENYLVEIGGEVRCKGVNAEGLVWTIGIDRPTDHNSNRELQATVVLNNRALATSGNYRKFYMRNGIKYAHTIDPETGYPVQHTLLSASVFAPDCASADAYATAFMVMGLEKTQAFLAMHPELKLDAYLIYSDEKGGYRTWESEGLKKDLEEMDVKKN